jgi:hypothetical protein
MMRRGTLDTSDGVLLGVLGLVALGVGITAIRLISGKGRKSDGGLFPPWFLRVLGLVFLVVGALLPFIDTGRVTVMFGALTLGAGCFYLANRQQRATQSLEASRSDT